MGLYLRIIHGSLRHPQGSRLGPEIPIRRPQFTIGSSARCNLRCANQSINTLHCVIEVDQDRIVVRDRGGLLGTFVNGRRVDQAACLFGGDRIRIGRLEFELIERGEEGSRGATTAAAQETICQAADTLVDLRRPASRSA